MRKGLALQLRLASSLTALKVLVLQVCTTVSILGEPESLKTWISALEIPVDSSQEHQKLQAMEGASVLYMLSIFIVSLLLKLYTNYN